ncbi:MAG: hypothetical protein SEPTF4163_005006 [Sporothrix epigloea]
MDTRSSTSAGSAAATASMKPPPRDLQHLYAEATNLRVASEMKKYYKFFQIPGIGNLAGGLPHLQFFPYDTLEAKVAKPERWTPSLNKLDIVDSDSEDDEDDLVRIVDRVDAISVSSRGPTSYSASTPSDRTAPERIIVPKLAPQGFAPDQKIDLATALQYGGTEGYPPLRAWIRKFTRDYLHPNVPYEGGPEVIMTVGSTDGLWKTLELFVDNWNPVRDDISTRPGLLCESFIYGNVLSQIAPKGMQAVEVQADSRGMVPYGPGSLEDVLDNWDLSKGRRPHMMYTVTIGHNPTGVVLSVERRKQIYEVCSRFDVIIVEDDPYWYMQFPSAAGNEAASRNLAKPKSPLVAPTINQAAGQRSSGSEFLDSLVPSFLSIDVDGRVVRLDTFSKTVAPGCRLGYVTAQPAIIERLTRITETCTQQPSGFVQSLISELLMGPLPVASSQKAVATKSKQVDPSSAGWQFNGWIRWLEGLRGEYERRMNCMCSILDEGSFQLKQGTPVRSADADWGVITKTQLYSFDWPRGGMFIWVRMHFEAHPLWYARRTNPADGIVDGPLLATSLMLFLTTKPYLVLISPGSMFSANENVRLKRGWAYFRLCFAAESDENNEDCSKRLVAGIQKFWKFKRVEELEDLLSSSSVTMEAAAEARDAGLMGNLGVWQGC